VTNSGELSTESAQPVVVRQLEGAHSRRAERKILALWLDNQWCDWLGCVALAAIVRIFFVPMIHLRQIDPAIRFSVYAAIAGGVLAVVAIAFTPLAILTALSPGRDLERIRVHDEDIRRNFLLATLVLLLCALALIGCGAADAGDRASSNAELVASVVLGLAVMKTLRVTALFAAILGAIGKDNLRDRRKRQRNQAA
jgi:predicted lysophospholipase L1 biosynthesis ABC-type transport system permease subunit